MTWQYPFIINSVYFFPRVPKLVTSVLLNKINIEPTFSFEWLKTPAQLSSHGH